MTEQNIQILDQLTAVNLNISVWTARKKLTTEDFGEVEIPPEELASLGSKKICDPESLRIFTTLKARAVGHMDKIGVRFLGGWAIPDGEREALHDRLVEIKDEFLLAKVKFLNNYDLAVQNWIDKHPGWERLIADSPVSSDEINKRLNFTWQFYKVVHPDQSYVSDNLQAEVANLGSTLFGEIAKEAQSIWNKCYTGKTEVSHKALSPLKSMRQKLTGLSFVEPTVAPIADLIEETLRGIPKRGLINGSHLLLLQGLVTVLKDPVLLFEHGRKVLNGQSTSSLLQDFLSNHEQERIDAQVAPGLELEVLDELSHSDDQDNSSVLDFDDDFESVEKQPDEIDSPLSIDSENDRSDHRDLNSDKQSQKVPYLDSLGLW